MGIVRVEKTLPECRVFWEGRIEENVFYIRYGQIGARTFRQTLRCPSPEAAAGLLDYHFLRKLDEGYEPVAVHLSICSICVGPDSDIGQEICDYLGNLLFQSGLAPRLFEENWQLFCSQPELFEHLPRSPYDVFFEWMGARRQLETEMPEFYAKAFRGGAGELVLFGTKRQFHIVALRGQPTAQEIAARVLGWKNVLNWTAADTLETLGEEFLERERLRRAGQS